MSNILDLLRNKTIQNAETTKEDILTTTVQEAEDAQKAEELKGLAASIVMTSDDVFKQECKLPEEFVPNKFSNKVHVVNSDFYLPDSYKIYYVSFDPKTFQYSSDIPDHLRFAAQKYWYKDIVDDLIQYVRPNNLEITQKVPFSLRIRHPNFQETGLFPTIKQTVHVVPDRTLFIKPDGEFDIAYWTTYVNGGFLGPTQIEPLIKINDFYSDFTFDHYLPVDDEDIPALSKKSSIQVNYNFYIKEFEEAAKDERIPEHIMPNVYAMIAHIENLAGNPNVESLNKLGGALEDILVEQRNGDSLTFRDNAQYFNEWSRKAASVDLIWQDEMIRKFGDIIFSAEELEKELFDLAQQRENIYPYSIQIDFSTDTTTEFTQMLKDTKLYKSFANTLVRELISNREGLQNNVVDQNFALCRCFDGLPTEDSASLRTWDLTKWWTDTMRAVAPPPVNMNQAPPTPLEAFGASVEGRSLAPPTQQEQAATVGEVVQEGQPVPFSILNNFTSRDFSTFIDAFEDMDELTVYDSFTAQILRLMFLGKLRKFIKKHMRDYCGLLSGKKAYSEPVMYRISKHAVTSNGTISESIQNFYIPNTNDIEDVSFVDTQVKYGKEYVYKIWAYHVVVGNMYQYQTPLKSEKTNPNLNAAIDTNGVATVFFDSMPLLNVVEIEQKQFEAIKLYDDPPLEPLVDFIPYIGEDSKIGISLCAQNGEKREEPEFLEPRDRREAVEILTKQRSTDGKIRYAGDDVVDRFEVFRINEHPESYFDFSGSKIAIVSTEMPSNSNQRSSETTFVDKIVPNRKYYYVFRAIDIHGHMSNPTWVYEIELVNNSGAIYPLIRTVEFKERQTKSPTKQMKRYLRIKAAEQQKDVNEERSKIPGLTKKGTKGKTFVMLGDDSRNTVFNREIKLRITSKSSGKKIDINFTLDKEINDINASSTELDNIDIDNPRSIAQILENLVNNK